MSRRTLSWLFVLVMLIPLTGAVARASSAAQGSVALVHVPIPTGDDLTRFEATGLPAYARLHGPDGEYLLAGASPADQRSLSVADLSPRVLDADVTGATYYLAYLMPGQPTPDWDAYGRVLLDDGIQVLLRAAAPAAERLAGVGVELCRLDLASKPLRPAQVKREIPAVDQQVPSIQAMMDQVDTATIYQYTGDLSGEWAAMVSGAPYTITTRYTYGGAPVYYATTLVRDRLRNLGLDVEKHTWQTGRPPNIIGELRGRTSPDDILILCAHLDDMPPGLLAPGADDNASGSVAVLIAAEILTRYRWDCTLRFAFWTGEEQGLLGSQAYAQRCHSRNENIVGVLNLDMIAWNTVGSSADIDLHARSSVPSSLELAQLFADVVAVYDLDLVPTIVPNGTSASDHAPFWTYGYPAVLGIEDFGDFNPYYHTTGDRLEYLDMAYYTEFVKASVGTFAHMGRQLPAVWDYHFYLPIVVRDSP